MSSFSIKRQVSALLTALLAALLTVTMMGEAFAAPSEDDVKKARENEQQGRNAVTRIEAQLAQLTANAQEKMVAAQVLAQELNKARDELDAARQAAADARKQADEATKRVEGARKHLSQLAATAYRTGSSLQNVNPYLQADGLQTVAMRQIAIELFGGQAEKKMQTFQAVEQVAQVMNRRADEANKRATAAEALVAKRSAAANAAFAQADAAKNDADQKRTGLVAELAKLHGRTVQVEKEYRAEQERQRRLREEAAARARAARIAREEAARRAAAARAAAARPAPAPAPAPGGGGPVGHVDGNKVVQIARRYLGIPYVWGGESWNGLDCSGLVKVTFAQLGIHLGHYTGWQYNSRLGRKVPLAQMRPGDLLFWYNGVEIYHVAIYAGNGQMIEAPRPGLNVMYAPVRYAQIMPYVVRF